MEIAQSIKRALAESYHLQISTVEQTSGGWSADAFIAKTGTTAYFVKAYDKHRPSVQPWIAHMPLYMPIVLWLYENTPLRERMVAPLLTVSQDYKAETQRHVLLVFPLLCGAALGNARLDARQIAQLAAILAELHCCGAALPMSTDAIAEDYCLPFLENLLPLLETGFPAAEFAMQIKTGAALLRELAESLRGAAPNTVLCHTDVHGGNLMWTGKLVLIDWEGVRLAPAEADLFSFTDGFPFDYARDSFMSAYKAIRTGYVENETATRFYRLRRRMEDICEFALSLAGDPLTEQERAEALRCLHAECAALSAMI